MVELVGNWIQLQGQLKFSNRFVKFGDYDQVSCVFRKSVFNFYQINALVIWLCFLNPFQKNYCGFVNVVNFVKCAFASEQILCRKDCFLLSLKKINDFFVCFLHLFPHHFVDFITELCSELMTFSALGFL